MGWIDRPGGRKQHRGNVPLVGGIAVFAGVLAGCVWSDGFSHFYQVVIIGATVLVVLGALDDRHGLSVRTRLLVQAGVISATIFVTGVYVHDLGGLFGYKVLLGWVGIPFTVVAIIGLLNAFNLMDGIDGLAGGLALVAIGAILASGSSAPGHDILTLLLALAAALIPFLAANFGWFGQKVFLGDAGSLLLGYLIAWALIGSSQLQIHRLSAVGVLWCVAVPVLDTFAVMFRRIRQGRSPFRPGRGHIHHLLLNAGLGPRATLVVLLILATLIVMLGGLIHRLHLGAGSNLAAFCALTVVYISTTEYVYQRQLAHQLPPDTPLALIRERAVQQNAQRYR